MSENVLIDMEIKARRYHAACGVFPIMLTAVEAAVLDQWRHRGGAETASCQQPISRRLSSWKPPLPYRLTYEPWHVAPIS